MCMSGGITIFSKLPCFEEVYSSVPSYHFGWLHYFNEYHRHHHHSICSAPTTLNAGTFHKPGFHYPS